MTTAGRAPAARPQGIGIPWLSLAIGAVVFVLAAITRADADLWGHLRFGLDILRDRELAAADPYSFTQDKPWVNHEWLSELSMAAAYRLGGSTGLILLKAGMLTSVFAIVWRGLAGTSHAARVLILIVIMFGTIHMTSAMRPQLWTALAMAVLCSVLQRDRPRDLWWLPALFALWVNCHGGWIVGAGVLLAWAAGDVFARPLRWRMWVPVVAASVLSTLANPYGYGLWLFMAETVRVTRDVPEWYPLWSTPFLNWPPWILATGAIVWFVRRGTADRWPVTAVLVLLSVGSLRVMRIESLFIVAAAVLLAPAVREAWPARTTPLSSFVKARQHWFAVAVMVVLALALVQTNARGLTCIGVWTRERPDQVMTRPLANARSGRLVTFFDWGQYAIWHFGPRLKVSMDGRRETIYSDRRLREHAAILAGTPDGLELLGEWRAEYVWLPASSRTTREWLRGHGYRIDVETTRSFVGVREDLPALPPVTNADVVSVPSCFPG